MSVRGAVMGLAVVGLAGEATAQSYQPQIQGYQAGPTQPYELERRVDSDTGRDAGLPIIECVTSPRPAIVIYDRAGDFSRVLPTEFIRRQTGIDGGRLFYGAWQYFAPVGYNNYQAAFENYFTNPDLYSINTRVHNAMEEFFDSTVSYRYPFASTAVGSGMYVQLHRGTQSTLTNREIGSFFRPWGRNGNVPVDFCAAVPR